MQRRFPTPAITLVALAGAIGMAGCAAPNPRFPSLLPRPGETRDEAERPAAPVAPVADAALDARLAALDKTLSDAAGGFPALADKARATVARARGAGTGSDAWLAAQSLLADLDLLRAQSLTALADLDRIVIDRGVADLPAYPGIEPLRARAEAQAKSQGDVIDQLQDQLAGA